MVIRAVGAVAAVGFAAGGMAGCATAPPQPVNVVADSFCIAAKKRSWSVDDTPETIAEAVKINAGIDRACGVKGKPPTS